MTRQQLLNTKTTQLGGLFILFLDYSARFFSRSPASSCCCLNSSMSFSVADWGISSGCEFSLLGYVCCWASGERSRKGVQGPCMEGTSVCHILRRRSELELPFCVFSRSIHLAISCCVLLRQLSHSRSPLTVVRKYK